MPIPPQFLKNNAGVVAAMSMKRDKHKKKTSQTPPKQSAGKQGAIARRLGNLSHPVDSAAYDAKEAAARNKKQ